MKRIIMIKKSNKKIINNNKISIIKNKRNWKYLKKVNYIKNIKIRNKLQIIS